LRQAIERKYTMLGRFSSIRLNTGAEVLLFYHCDYMGALTATKVS
jgi:hypothetical protein